MSRLQRVSRFAVLISIMLGALFSLLPQRWIEGRFGISPDSGSGMLELLIISAPIACSAALAVFAFRSSVNSRRESSLEAPLRRR